MAIAALTMAVQNGIVMAFAVLYLPLIEEFGASRGEVAAVQSVVLLLGGLGGPAIGYALDRLGPRRLFQGGTLLAALGLVLASRAGSLPVLLLTYGLVTGLGLAALGSQPNMVVAALWYPGARGKAIAVADLGTGFGAFVFIPLAQALVVRYGWRTALLLWAALLVLALIPANAFQRMPTGRGARDGSGETEGPAPDAGWRPATAARAPAFWWLIAVRFLSAMAFPLMNVHLVAFAVGGGISAAAAATALGSVSLVSLGGRLLTGWLSDHLGRAPTLTLTYASAMVGIANLGFLAWTGWTGWLAGYVLFYGLAQGSSGIVTAARAADIFAGRSFGTIYGWIVLATGPGEAIGAWAGGAIFDLTGSYLWAFGFVMLALLAGIAAIWQVGGRPQAGDLRARRST